MIDPWGTIAAFFRFSRRRGAVSEMKAIRIHAVVFEEHGWFCLQCLEHDISVQSETLDGLHEELRRTLDARVRVAVELGIEPFKSLEKAPRKFWEMYKVGEQQQSGNASAYSR